MREGKREREGNRKSTEEGRTNKRSGRGEYRSRGYIFEKNVGG